MAQKISLGIVVFEITDDCNQHCRFCYNYWKGQGTAAPLHASYARAHKTLRQLFRQARVESLSFSGGEPLLVPRLYDLVLDARMHAARVNVLTNGTLLSPKEMGLMRTLDVGRVQIPLLSARPDVHDALTQVKGSWEKAVAALKQVIEWDVARATAVLILTGENRDDLAATLDLYRQLGVQSVLLNRFNVGGTGLLYKESLSLSHAQLRESFAVVDAFAATTGIRFSSGVCTPMCVLPPRDYPHIAFSFCNTDVKSRPLTLNFRGDVRFCNHSPRIMGNIFEKPMGEILGDPANTAYYAVLPASCGDCSFLNLCRGGCRAASEQLYHDFSRVDPLV